MSKPILVKLCAALSVATAACSSTGSNESEPPLDPLARERTLPHLVLELEEEPSGWETVDAILRVHDEGEPVTLHAAVGHRGFSSRRFPKKQFRLVTTDEAGKAAPVELLGMPAHDEWVLYGPYPDKSLIRNALTYDLARDMGQYAPRTRMVTVSVRTSPRARADYEGIYALVERLHLGPDHIDLARTAGEGEGARTAYLAQFDREEPGSLFLRGKHSGAEISLSWPAEADLTPGQREHLLETLERFEDALYVTGEGFMEMLDERALIDFFLIQELSRNVDGFRRSSFFTLPIDGPITFGPVWDFNVAYGNFENEGFASFRGFNHEDPVKAHLWWPRLLESDELREPITLRWMELRDGVLSDDALSERVQALADEVRSEARFNFLRWPVVGERVWPNAVVYADYDLAVEGLESWLRSRVAWLDAAFEAWLAD